MKLSKNSKVWRIQIHSKDVVSGDDANGMYRINIPDVVMNDQEYQIALESFKTSTALASIGIIQIGIPTPSTYSTDTQAFESSFLTTTNGEFGRITYDTIGHKVCNPDFLRNSLINIKFKKMDGTLFNAGEVNNWIIDLVVYPIP